MRVHWQATPFSEDGQQIAEPVNRWTDLDQHLGTALVAPPGLFAGPAGYWLVTITPATTEGMAEAYVVGGTVGPPLSLTLNEQARLVDPDVPWDDLDPGISTVVEVLTLAGLRTIASCQGHGEGDAWITILATGRPKQRLELIHKVLEANGWERHCIISEEHDADGAQGWVKLRWWGAVPFR